MGVEYTQVAKYIPIWRVWSRFFRVIQKHGDTISHTAEAAPLEPEPDFTFGSASVLLLSSFFSDKHMFGVGQSNSRTGALRGRIESGRSISRGSINSDEPYITFRDLQLTHYVQVWSVLIGPATLHFAILMNGVETHSNIMNTTLCQSAA